MRTTAIALIGIVVCTTSGCFLWKKSEAPVPTKQQFVLHGIIDFNKSKIRPDSMVVIQEAAAKLNEQGNLAVLVEGHSDAKGSPEYNQRLSVRRAESVRDALVQLGIAKGRIVVVGKGSSEPIASSATREGRARNRRVVLVVYEPES
jgi:OOP family OmpA-OmpF porin